MNTYQAYETLNLESSASFEQVKSAYRKLALESHPDKAKDESDLKFKKVTEAYHLLKKYHKEGKKGKDAIYNDVKTKTKTDFKRKPQWGAPPGEKIPEEDWSKYTKEFEEDAGFWREYERKFWEEYDAAMKGGDSKEEFEKTKEPKVQPNLLVEVDPTLCIGCCSCEIIAPRVFTVDKNSKMNPKSKVINPKGAGFNKIMNAAETCPTRAINVQNKDTREKIYPI